MASKLLVDELAPYSHATDVSLATGKNIAGANTQFKITGGANTNVLTTDGSGGLTWGAAVGGKVLQVVQGTVLSATQGTTSATFVDMSPSLEVSITPSASTSKVLINFVVNVGLNSGWHAYFKMDRGGTDIGVGDTSGSRKRATLEVSTGAIAIGTNGSMTYLDAPATTSATVYKIQWATESGGTIYLNRSLTWTDSSNWSTCISTITAMEIGV